jgi:hypothetical protein
VNVLSGLNLKLVLTKIIKRNISSGRTNSVDVCSVDREVTGVEFEIDLLAELPVT